MKRTLIATTLLISSGLIFAAEQNHDHQSQPSHQTQGEKGMTEEAMSEMMQKDMEKMRSQMAEIHKTVDPIKQEELIEAHLATMHKVMERMHKMHGGNDAMMGQKSMEKQMNMMQMMMDQMIQNQQVRQENKKTKVKRHDHMETK